MTPEPSPQKPSRFDKLLDTISRISMIVTGVALVVLTVIFGWLVFGRYVLNATPTWVEQVSLLLVALIGFVGASVGIHEKTHLSVSYFRDISPPRIKWFFEGLSHLIIAVFGGVMAVYSWQLVQFKWGTAIPLIHVPEGLRAVPIMICGVAIMLYAIGHLIRFFKHTEKSNDIDG